MNMPYLSIVIPTFNSERTIEATLESIAIQTRKDFEVIVIDGKSTDRTVDIANQFKGRIANLNVSSESDLGIYDAMNKGANKAKGKWLYFLGSDDTLYDSRVIESVFAAPIPSHVMMVYGRIHEVTRNFITPIDFYFGNLAKYNICHQAIFYSANVFKKFKYSLDYGLLGDWDLNLRLVGRYENTLYPVNVLVCRYSGSGLSAEWKDRPEYKTYFSNVLVNYWRYLPFLRFIAKVGGVMTRRFLRSIRKDYR
jgi:glycosyltransferase involved in cell wall biosynthesis